MVGIYLILESVGESYNKGLRNYYERVIEIIESFPEDRILERGCGDPFYGKSLSFGEGSTLDMLTENENHLLVVGGNASACVRRTVRYIEAWACLRNYLHNSGGILNFHFPLCAIWDGSYEKPSGEIAEIIRSYAVDSPLITEGVITERRRRKEFKVVHRPKYTVNLDGKTEKDVQPVSPILLSGMSFPPVQIKINPADFYIVNSGALLGSLKHFHIDSDEISRRGDNFTHITLNLYDNEAVKDFL